MATRIELVRIDLPDGSTVVKNDIEADDMVWIKHLNDVNAPLRLRIGEQAVVTIISTSERPSEREAISFNTMQDGIYISGFQSDRVSPTKHVHSFTVAARSWEETEKDDDPLASMIIRIHTSYPGTVSLTSRDMRLHVLVLPREEEYAADVKVEGAIESAPGSISFGGEDLTVNNDGDFEHDPEPIELEEVDLDKMTIADLIELSDQGKLFYQVK